MMWEVKGKKKMHIDEEVREGKNNNIPPPLSLVVQKC